jgi:hypothetical protein
MSNVSRQTQLHRDMIIRPLPKLWLVVGVALLLSKSALAHDASLIDETVDATCTAFLAPVLGRQDIARLATERTIDSRVVCSCAKKNTRDDTRLSQYFSMNRELLAAQTEAGPIRSYILGRILQSVLTCFSAELSETLNASTAVK